MKFKFLILLVIFVNCSKTLFSQKKRIIIEADLSGYTGYLPVSNHPLWQGDDSLVIEELPEGNTMGAEYLLFGMTGDSLNPRNDSASSGRHRKKWRNKAIKKGYLYKWDFEVDLPREVSHQTLLGGAYLLYPGDSIHVTYSGTKPFFSGKGFEKIKIQYELDRILLNDNEPVRKEEEKLTPDEFLVYSRFYDWQIQKTMNFMENYRSKLNPSDFERLMAKGMFAIELSRLSLFLRFFFVNNEERKKGNYNKVMVQIWDSTMYKPWSKWFRSASVQDMPGVGNRVYLHNFVTIEIQRKFNFQSNDSLSNQLIQKKLIYEKMKSDYSGLSREKLLCAFIEEQFVEEMGSYSWFAQSILKDYYKTPGFPAYKDWIKAWEKKHLYVVASSDSKGFIGAPLFTLKDTSYNDFSEKNIIGKIVIVNFWYTGCEPCKQTAHDLKQVQDIFKNDTNIVFLHVSADKNSSIWKTSIREAVFVPGNGIHLSTGVAGINHVMLKDFDALVFPTVRFIDHLGYITVNKNKPTANVLTLQEMTDGIAKESARFKDGPYVLYSGNKNKAYSITDGSVRSQENVRQIECATDQPFNLKINLQEKLTIPPSEYEMPEEMMVLSDIEGNFSALRKLLQVNKVIDKDLNWSFGKGHLVFGGDMFDRGDQVTECLWLIYSLEEKAKKAGGFVHFILGNHEIMNLNGQSNYVREKYIRNYFLMGKTLTEIYNEQSELGRWIRTKNIVERIGNNLFTHGGISPEVNNLPLTLEQINNTARPYYDKSAIAIASVGTHLSILFNSYKSPFWYRHYYKGDHFSKSQNKLIRRATDSQIDSTCNKFKVAHIITGHTIVADTISVRFNNKIINIDTQHKVESGEALFIEKHNYYRVSAIGKKIFLFKDEDYTLGSNRPLNNRLVLHD